MLTATLDRLEHVLMAQGQSINQLLAMSGSSAPSVQSPSTSAPAPESNMFAQTATLAHPGYGQAEAGHMSQQTSPYSQQNPGMMAGDARAGYAGFNDGGYQQTPSTTTTTTDPYQRRDPTLLQHDSKNLFANGNVSSNAQNYSAMKSTAPSQDQDLPPYDLLYSLADLYFKHVNTWCPILHRKSTFDALFGPSSLEEADRIILHAMVATTLRYSSDPRLTDELKDNYHHASKQKVLLYGLDNSSVKALQALVILALDLCGESNGPPGWNLLALITRSAVQLGLSIEATSAAVSPAIPSIYTLRAMALPEPTSWIEDESRRRLFWMIYVLDRYATITTAFDFALDENEIDRKLPCRDDFFTQNRPTETRWYRPNNTTEKNVDGTDHMGSFSYYVEVMTILSQIHHFLKKPVDIGRADDVERWRTEYRELNSTLDSWKEGLPSEYADSQRLFDPNSSNKVVNVGWIMLQATYHTTVMRLHSSAAYPARRSRLFEPSFRASQICMVAADSISALCSYSRSNGMLNKLGPPFAFSVWVAARLLLVHSSTIDHHTNPNVQYFINTLIELGNHWHVATRYATLLQRVLDEFADSEQNASPTAEREIPTSVKILSDMRRNAHDLDILMSRQPRQPSLIQSTSTPSKTPAPNELDYLDVFDFFNMPRVSFDVNNPAATAMSAPMMGFPDPSMVGQGYDAGMGWDASADWFTSPTG